MAKNEQGFMGERKTEKKAKVEKPVKGKRATTVKTGNTIKVTIPRNPMDAYKLGLYMAQYQ